MPQCEQNGGRWRGQRGDWDFERGRGQWRGPREESFWHTPGTEYATASTGDEDWRFGYRGNPGGYGRWEDAPDWSGGPGFEGDFGRGRFGYGEPYGRNDIYGGMPGGYGGRGMASRGYRSDYGEGRWGPGMTDEFGPGRFRAGPGGYGRPDQFGRFGGRPWTGEGSFFGRGPRGYQRSDERIREDVCEVLTAHWDVDASDIDVGVQDGEVMLTGSVASRDQKRLAEDAIESVPGIRDVNNQLRVAHSQHGSMGGTFDDASAMTGTGAARDRSETGQHREAVGAGTSANSKPR